MKVWIINFAQPQRGDMLGTAIALMAFLMLLGCAAGQSPPSPTLIESVQVQEKLRAGYADFRAGAYDRAIEIFQAIVDRYPEGQAVEEAQWILGKSYEAKGELKTALKEYRSFRTNFPQTVHGGEVIEKIRSLEETLSLSSQGTSLEAALPAEYRIGREDELEISVYGDETLTKTQVVRPDGKIAFPLVGDLLAAGTTPDLLRVQLTEGPAKPTSDSDRC
jgi:tetratricopeptide (TPR) repeat protein